MSSNNDIDYTTDVGKVRALIPDVTTVYDPMLDDEEFLLSDGEINVYLGLNNGSIRLAAADACEALGTNDLLIGKVIITQDYSTDASKVSAQMLARAASLRKQAALTGDAGASIDAGMSVVRII